MNLLILEDSPSDSLLLTTSLEKITGLQVQKVVPRLEEIEPNLEDVDCVVLDLKIPSCSELQIWDLAKKLRSQVLVAIHSGKADPELAYQCGKEGFYFIPKGNLTNFGAECAFRYLVGVCERGQ